jgi:hypothetical protein
MFDHTGISVRLETLGGRIRDPHYLKFNSSQQQLTMRLVTDLEDLFDEVERACTDKAR